jgi:hypothetical protein
MFQGKKNAFAAPLLLLACLLQVESSGASVSAFLKSGSGGATCATGTSAIAFAGSESSLPILLCFSATTESICGFSYRIRSGPSENGAFFLGSRTAASLLPFLYGAPTFTPFSIDQSPSGIDLGAGTQSNAPLSTGANQLIATLAVVPQATAVSATYSISLDATSVVSIDDGTGDCSNPLEQQVSATISLLRSTPPSITSTDAAVFTVGFAASFQVVASGNPVPTFAVGGALPAGVSLDTASGLLSGTPALGRVATYPLIITASNGNLPNASQSFTLKVQKANQALNFDPIADRAFSATPFAVTATSSLGGAYPVQVSSATASTCSLVANNVTMLAAGICTIVATQAGDANYNSATVSRSFLISAVAPAAPTIGTATAGIGSVTVSFSAPAFTGGTSIQSYTATCGAQSAASSNPPITVSGLPSGTPVTCTVTAFNGLITSAPSSASNSITPLAPTYAVTGAASPVAGGSVTCTSPVSHGNNTTCTVSTNAGYTLTNISGCGGTPGTTSPYMTGAITATCTVTATLNSSLALVKVVSRKSHGTAGNKDITLLHAEPIGGNVTTEPRAEQMGGHAIVFVFDAPVTSYNSISVVDPQSTPIIPTSVTPTGLELRVLLPSQPDATRVSISITGVNGSTAAQSSVGFLYGDVTNSRRVTAADIAVAKASIGITNNDNFRADVNVGGAINSADVSVVKSRSGRMLP